MVYIAFMKLKAYTIIIFSILFVACNKQKADQINKPEPTDQINYNSITECHKAENPFPSQITANIEGTWVWEKKACFWSGNETFSADKHVVIQFTDGALYKVTEDGKLISEGTWKLSKSGDESWTLNCSESTQYLHGRIILCKDELVLNSSHIDGCDLYYKKR